MSRKAAPRRKAETGLDKVLFVRANEELLKELDRLCDRKKEEQPGVSLSRSDVARAILWAAIRREENEDK